MAQILSYGFGLFVGKLFHSDLCSYVRLPFISWAFHSNRNTNFVLKCWGYFDWKSETPQLSTKLYSTIYPSAKTLKPAEVNILIVLFQMHLRKCGQPVKTQFFKLIYWKQEKWLINCKTWLECQGPKCDGLVRTSSNQQVCEGFLVSMYQKLSKEEQQMVWRQVHGRSRLTDGHGEWRVWRIWFDEEKRYAGHATTACCVWGCVAADWSESHCVTFLITKSAHWRSLTLTHCLCLIPTL